MSSTRRGRPPSKAPSASRGDGAQDGERPGGLTGRLWALDGFQQRHRRTSFVAAVLKKFGDDQGGQLAALISYYAFVSLFPLLLVLVTILGYVLQGDPAERDRILSGTLGQFPIIRDQLKLQPLTGNALPLVVGIVVSLLAGLGIMGASQTAFNRIWHVPFKDRPNFLFSRLRSLGMLAILGTVAIVSTVAAGFVGASSHGAPAVVAGVLVAFAANLLLFMIAFKLLTAIELDWRVLVPGVIVAAVLWQLLQHLGGYYIDHILKRTGPLYGVFALVLGLLAWLYLGGLLTVLAAEVNVVKARRLWPRSFFGEPLLAADRRALVESAETEERVQQENIEVDFGDGPGSR
jgi:YihY family inner membrane protein